MAKASETVTGSSCACVKNQRVIADNGKVVEYREVMKATFVWAPSAPKAAKKK